MLSKIQSRILVDEKPIELPELIQFCEDDASGALVVFSGSVRNYFEGRVVTAVEYHGYAEMAEKILDQIVQLAFAQWSLNKIAVSHRTGLLRLREISLAIVTSAGHRQQAFEANRFILEEIKKDLPIWKKDIYHEGQAEWQAKI